jgi:hypothetical protein
MPSKVAAVLTVLVLLSTWVVPLHVQACTPGMAYLGDVTVPDDTRFKPGEAFDKTWKLKNKGDCEWTPQYALANVGGEPLATQSGKPLGRAGDSHPLGQAIAPGASVDVTVHMQAPLDQGRHDSYWHLVDDVGQSVGEMFYVRIDVEGVAAPAPAGPAAGTFLIPDQPDSVWLWGAPTADHHQDDVLPAGRYRVLKTEQQGLWTQIDLGSRQPWVFTGENSGIHEETVGGTPPLAPTASQP